MLKMLEYSLKAQEHTGSNLVCDTCNKGMFKHNTLTVTQKVEIFHESIGYRLLNPQRGIYFLCQDCLPKTVARYEQLNKLNPPNQ